MIQTRSKLALLAILAMAALARLYEIDKADIWIDEANLILTAKQPLLAILDKLRLDSSPPLLYFVLHFWIRVFGDGSVALRLLSSLAGVALVASIYWAGRELISRRVGLWAAFFVAVSPFQAYYSQQVRMYAPLALFALLSVVFLVRQLRTGARRDFALWLAVTILALYTHNFAIYLLLVHGVLIAISGKLVRSYRSWLVAAAILALAYAPWIPFLFDQLGNQDHYAWYLRHWKYYGPWGSVVLTLRSYSPAAEYVTFTDVGMFATWRGWVTLGVAGLAVFGACELALRRRQRGPVEALWPLVFLVVSIASGLIVSSLMTPNYVPGRVDQMIFPAFALLVGVGLRYLRPAPLRIAVAATILAVSAWSKFDLYPDYHPRGLQGSDRDLAARIADHWQPEDVIITTSLTRGPLQYYLGRAGIEARFISYPREAAAHLGSQNDARLLSDLPALEREANAVTTQARSMTGAEGRLFLVWARSKLNRFLAHHLMRSRFGFQQVKNLGLFRQYGTGVFVEARVYRPDPDR